MHPIAAVFLALLVIILYKPHQANKYNYILGSSIYTYKYSSKNLKGEMPGLRNIS